MDGGEPYLPPQLPKRPSQPLIPLFIGAFLSFGAVVVISELAKVPFDARSMSLNAFPAAILPTPARVRNKGDRFK